MPFHYGYWDDDGRPWAVNELTLYDWDPVSKQPFLKYAAVRLRKVKGDEPYQMNEPRRDEGPKPAPETPRPHVADYLALLHASSNATAEALFAVAEAHQAEPDISPICKMLGRFSLQHVRDLQPCIERYGEIEGQGREASQLLEALQPVHHEGPLRVGWGCPPGFDTAMVLQNKLGPVNPNWIATAGGHFCLQPGGVSEV